MVKILIQKGLEGRTRKAEPYPLYTGTRQRYKDGKGTLFLSVQGTSFGAFTPERKPVIP